MEGEYSLRFAEYTVTKRAQGKNLAGRIALWAGYVAFAAAYTAVFLGVWLLPQVLAVLPLFMAIFVYLTWHLTHYDIRVSLDSGRFTVMKLAGRRKRVKWDKRIQEVTSGGPLSALPSGTPFLDLRGDGKSKNGWFLTFGDTTVVFEATKKLIGAIRFYVPHAAEGEGELTL